MNFSNCVHDKCIERTVDCRNSIRLKMNFWKSLHDSCYMSPLSTHTSCVSLFAKYHASRCRRYVHATCRRLTTRYPKQILYRYIYMNFDAREFYNVFFADVTLDQRRSESDYVALTPCTRQFDIWAIVPSYSGHARVRFRILRFNDSNRRANGVRDGLTTREIIARIYN